jgi:hypothetical protein
MSWTRRRRPFGKETEEQHGKKIEEFYYPMVAVMGYMGNELY